MSKVFLIRVQRGLHNRRQALNLQHVVCGPHITLTWPLGGLFVLYPAGCVCCRTGRVVDGPEMSGDDVKAQEPQSPSDTCRASPWQEILKADFEPSPDLAIKTEGAVNGCWVYGPVEDPRRHRAHQNVQANQTRTISPISRRHR